MLGERSHQYVSHPSSELPVQSGVRFAQQPSRETTGTVPSIGGLIPSHANFQLRQRIGEGGMGIVFEALDLALRRTVAIKFAKDPHYNDAIIKEAQAIAVVKHPSMPMIYSLGEHNGRAFLVMERLRGRILFEEIVEKIQTNTTFDLANVLSILISIAEALDAVHQAGLTHRDLKPDNIMILPARRLVLLDFGIAQPDTLFDRKDYSGSPAYMAPETIRLTAQASEAHMIDLYALGVIAFELLTLRLPFEQRSVQAQFCAHVMNSVPDLHALRANLPKPLVVLINELLAKDPLDRPSSAQEVLFRLRRIESNLERSH